jgi:hypothetical protein
VARVQTRTGTAAPDADEWIGMLHVRRVRLVVSATRTTAYVEGIRHRRAVVEAVPVTQAVRLQARGVPLSLEHVA